MEPVQDPASNESFYSPVKGTKRPLCMILLAYHAFANVVLFYRACLDAGIAEAEQCKHNIARHLPELRLMEQSLGSSRGLTESGRLLFDPLAELIADL
jgi:HEXXH motif-containing protein